MPVNADWYDKTQNIIICRYVGNWTLAEASGVTPLINQFLQQAIGRTDLIADFSESTYAPPVGTLWTWKQNAEFRDSTFPDWGLMVIVNPSGNRVYDAFFAEGTQTSDVLRKHCRLARSGVEAVQIILADRANTPQDKA